MILLEVELLVIRPYNKEILIHKFIQDYIKKKHHKFINENDLIA